MSDLHALLPDFPDVAKHAALIAGLETHRVSLSELLTLDAAEVGKRTRLPLIDLQRLCEEVRAQLAQQVLQTLTRQPTGTAGTAAAGGTSPVAPAGGRIGTLDPVLDTALGGGFPTGLLSEVVGESGAGKTQLLLSLLLAVQLPPPRGLGRKALYISSEAPLATGRLTQIIRSHPDSPVLRQHCSLEAIATIRTPDLEAQEHILTHQLPVQLAKAEQFGGHAGSFGLVVLDSVAANFRPFFGGGTERGGGGGGQAAGQAGGQGNSLAARSLELARLGMLLRSLARRHNLAVVVANQVADRFDGSNGFDRSGTGDGGLVSLSQQWVGSGSSRPRQMPSAVMTSATKRLRQGGNGPMLPPPIPAPQQPPSSSHMPLTQESPLAARSKRQQQGQAQLPLLPMSSQSEAGGEAPVASVLPPFPPLLPPASNTDNISPSSSQYIPPSPFPPAPPAPPVLQLDYQQRWFTGWGDSPGALMGNGTGNTRNKTPALGLVWATQLGMRVALIKAPRIGGRPKAGGGFHYEAEDEDEEEYDEGSVAERHNMGAPRLRNSWRRWMKVVFAPHVAATGSTAASGGGGGGNAATQKRLKPMSSLATRMQGAVEFEITMGGLHSMVSADAAVTR